MVLTATILDNETYKPKYMQGMISVEKASILQKLSMKRFQTESVNDMKLRRFLGHVSVNRRSTEIVQTATFEEDMVAEIEDQCLYDEDVAWDGLSLPHRTTSLPMRQAECSKNTREDRTQQSLILDPIELLEKAGGVDLEGCRADAAGTISNKTADELLMAIDQDWMYDLLDLHIRESGSAQPLSRSVVIQLWKRILESVAVYANKKTRAEETYAMRQLEAHGLPKDDHLFGLGLDCDHKQYSSFSSRTGVAL